MQSKLQDLLFLPVSGPRGASSRYRVFQFLPAIAAAGWTYALHLPPASSGRGIRRLLTAFQERGEIDERARMARAVFLQKRLLAASQTRKLARARPMLFDFDDAIFTTPTGDRSWMAQRRVENRLKAVLSEAKVVVAGNRYLYEYACQHASRVIHLPTVVDVSRYPAKQHRDVREIVVGWIGHSVNHPYLVGMADVLRNIAKSRKARLLVVSDRDLEIPGITIENRRWSEETEVADILCMDIGIMPLPDDSWSRGKCGLKAIQYMAAGIPVVCAAVGANVEIVRDGIDGFCATSDAAWQEGLAELCANPGLRHGMGLSGRERVGEAYSLKSAASVLLETLAALCGRNPSVG